MEINKKLRELVSTFSRREDVSKLAPEGGVGIDLGVAGGDFSEHVLKTSKLGYLYSVDMWAGDRGRGVGRNGADRGGSVRSISEIADRYDENARAHDDFLAQVGHTASGKPIDEVEFAALLAQSAALLGLGPDHDLLDIGCGNGFVTSHMSRLARRTVGVDFSAGLIAVARRHHTGNGEDYYVLDALRVGALAAQTGLRFERIMAYSLLQHLSADALEPLLRQIAMVAAERHVILLGFVPDRDRRWRFYDTLTKKLRYLGRRLRGREMLGTWWDARAIAAVAARCGYECRFEPMSMGTSGAHYRFNVVLERHA